MADAPQKKLRFRKQSTSAKPGTLAKAKSDVSFLTAKMAASKSQGMPEGYTAKLAEAKSAASRARAARAHQSDRTHQARRDAVRDRYGKKES